MTSSNAPQVNAIAEAVTYAASSILLARNYTKNPQKAMRSSRRRPLFVLAATGVNLGMKELAKTSDNADLKKQVAAVDVPVSAAVGFASAGVSMIIDKVVIGDRATLSKKRVAARTVLAVAQMVAVVEARKEIARRKVEKNEAESA